MKTKQISTILISIFTVVFFALYVQSCTNEEDTTIDVQTKVNKLLASDKYQKFSITSNYLAHKFVLNYSKLSNTDKSKIQTLLKDLTENNPSLDKYNEFCKLININYSKEFTRIEMLKTDMFNEANIEGLSRKDLMIALKKHEMSDNSTPRLKDGGEGLTEAQRRCLNVCYAGWQVDIIKCLCSGNPIAICACGLVAAGSLAKCVEDCK